MFERGLVSPAAFDSSVNTSHSGEAKQQRNDAEAVSSAGAGVTAGD